jgi:hypothetical protein
MKRIILLVALVLPLVARAQLDMSAHMYWMGYGNRETQFYGAGGVHYLGKINDTIPHALAISERFDYGNGGQGSPGERSAYILNQHPGDTARIYEFPGHRVFPAKFNDDKYVDFLCWSTDRRTITILLGTPKIDSFDTVVAMRNLKFENLENEIIVADLDSNGYDDALILAREDSKAYLFKGGAFFDSTPAITPHAVAASQFLSVGKVRNRSQVYLCESREHLDTVWVNLYPCGPAFSFDHWSDSVLCTIDTSRYSNLSNGFSTIDADGDGVDDIFLSGYDNDYKPSFKINTTIFVYKGGANIDKLPTYYFHRPFQTNSSTFGTQMIDVGDVTGNKYHSLLVNDPDAYMGGGAIFLYNLGKGLADACTGYAEGPYSDNDCFGCCLTALPDLDSDGRAEFATGYAGRNSDRIPIGAGGVFILKGDAAYGPKVGVDEQFNVPNRMGLIQNYPNPFSRLTTIYISLDATSGKEARLSVIDALGREVAVLLTGPAGRMTHSVVFDGSKLPGGMYVCRFTLGEERVSTPMIIMR